MLDGRINVIPMVEGSHYGKSRDQYLPLRNLWCGY